MMDSPSLCIADTNVLIDLHNGGVLAAMFLLPYTFGAPDVIVAELQVPDGQSLVSMGLCSEELPAEQVLEVAALAEQHRTVQERHVADWRPAAAPPGGSRGHPGPWGAVGAG
jgi:hypothetical protein